MLNESDAIGEPPREPQRSLGDPAALLAGYLDFYRDAVRPKLDGLSEADARGRSTPGTPAIWTSPAN